MYIYIYTAEYLDKILWGVFEQAVGQQVPRKEQGLGVECVLNLPVDTLQSKSFQEISVRLPIRLRGFGLRSFAETAPQAFIGGVEMALGGGEAEQGWWRILLESGSRTGVEYGGCWAKLQREGQQIATFIESEHLLGTIVGQYRRLVSTCAVRAQAMCTLARVGLITPAARDAARRRQVAMRMEAQMKEERRAQWMASLQGPGWARRDRCHGM